MMLWRSLLVLSISAAVHAQVAESGVDKTARPVADLWKFDHYPNYEELSAGLADLDRWTERPGELLAAGAGRSAGAVE